MKQIHILSILLWLLFTLPIAAQKEYDCSKYYGTWVYENQDTVFTVQIKEFTHTYGENRVSTRKLKVIGGNYKFEVNGKTIYDYFTSIPITIDEIGQEQSGYSKYGIYFFSFTTIREREDDGKLFGITDPIKKHHNGEPILALWLKILPNGNLKWTLEDYETLRRKCLYEDDGEIPVGYSMPTHAIFRKVE